MRLIVLISFFFLSILKMQGQELTPKKFRINGYVKDMQTFSFEKSASTLVTNNFIHNRINIKYQPIAPLTFAIELRNRFFVGEQIRLTPNFGTIIGQDNGLVDMSFTYLDNPPVVFHTKIDRLYIDWNKDHWNIRAGRQRINWGINTAWNPNDIFNTYNFLDFDYEERPGTDALKVAYQFKGFNSLELVMKPAQGRNDYIGALKYAFNKTGYDFQFFVGNYQRDIVLGTGWAGNIKEAGFKGEATYFQGWDNIGSFDYTLSAATSFDYSFKKGWYINGSFLYNSNGQNQLYSGTEISTFLLTPKSLMPGKYSFLYQTMKTFTPLFSGSFSIIYSPQINLLILNPYVSYSIANNWDVDLTVQSFFANNVNDEFNVLGNTVYLRLKWSFSN